MREAHPSDADVGMAWYASDTPGMGGRLRSEPEDFRVRELEAIDPEPVDADAAAYPHLLVRATLRNWDTNEFARELANHLEVSRGRVQWAGMKDRRAVTTQLFSLADIDPERVPPITEADLEVVGRFGRALQFGDLVGNAFTVTVRDVERPDTVPATTEALHAVGGGRGNPDRVGVPNYFGHQRFGSLRPITHRVGFAIVEEDWDAAVMTYLAESNDAEPPDSRQARETVAETRDWDAALTAFPNRLRYERAMLHVLADGGSFQEALGALPENLRRLFVHAAQSYVFNRIISERLDRGLPITEPVAGDVVCFTTDHDPVVVPDTDRLQRVTPDRVDVVGRHCRRGRAYVTAPLVGTDTTLGDGDPGDVEATVLEEVGLTPEQFSLPDPYDSSGTRRAIVVHTTVDTSVDRDTVEMMFSLPKGSYATVVLREYLKTAPTDL